PGHDARALTNRDPTSARGRKQLLRSGVLLAMWIMRGLGLLFFLLGAAMLVVGLGGFADHWLEANVSCGDSYTQHQCAPGEAQGVLPLGGAIFSGVRLILAGGP